MKYQKIKSKLMRVYEFQREFQIRYPRTHAFITNKGKDIDLTNDLIVDFLRDTNNLLWVYSNPNILCKYIDDTLPLIPTLLTFHSLTEI